MQFPFVKITEIGAHSITLLTKALKEANQKKRYEFYCSQLNL